HTVSLCLQVDGRHGRERAASRVVDHLHVEVVEAAVHGQARPLRRTVHTHTHALMTLQSVDLAVGLLDHPAAFAPLPALPALRRTFSPRHMTPLPLYGSGGRSPRRLAATWPTSSIEIPVTENLVWSATSMVMPCG